LGGLAVRFSATVAATAAITATATYMDALLFCECGLALCFAMVKA
jgi:hypothetical protein